MPNYSVFQSDPNNLRTLINGQDSLGVNHPVRTDINGNLTTVVLDGTISNLGTISNIGTITEVISVGTVSSVLGATITAGTLTAIGTISNLTDVGTISSVLGATITAGTLTAIGTISNLTDVGTISSVLGATITAGTLTAVGTVTNLGILSTLTAISQKNFLEPQSITGVVTSNTFTALPNILTSVLGTTSFFVYNFGPGGSIDAQIEISADGANYFVDTLDTNVLVGSVDVIVPARFLKYTRLAYRSTTTNTPSSITVIADSQGT